MSADRITRKRRFVVTRRRGLVWGWKTQLGMRGYGIDFGRFALVLLLDPKAGTPSEDTE